MGLAKYFKITVLIVFVYIYLYDPPIKVLPNLTWLSLPFVYAYLIYNSLTVKLFYLFKYEIFLLVLLVLYTLGRDFDWTSGTFNKTYLFGNATLLIEVIPYSLFIADVCYRMKKLAQKSSYDNKLMDVVLWTCFLASLFTVIMLINPALSAKINSDILETSDYQKSNLIRGFGFASMLTYGYGIAQGIAAAIILLKMSMNPKYLLAYMAAFILLLISILVNARIGMTPIIIMTLYLIFIKGRIKIFLYGSGVIGVLIWAFLSTDFAAKYQKTIEWGMSFFTQTLGFVSGSNHSSGQTTYDVLFGRMIILPDTFMGWIVGNGKDIFAGASNNKVTEAIGHSDVGFITQLYFGGLIYVGLILLLITLMAIRIYRFKKYSWFLILFVFTVIIANIKGYFVTNQPAFRLFILFYMGFIYYSFRLRIDKKLMTQAIDNK